MQLIDNHLIDKVSAAAAASPRLRMNYNFHESPDSKSQRLLNALEPGTVMPIHRHQHTSETYVLLRGKLKVMFYNSSKELTESAVLEPTAGVYGVNIPAGQWHSLEVLEPRTVILCCREFFDCAVPQSSELVLRPFNESLSWVWAHACYVVAQLDYNLSMQANMQAHAQSRWVRLVGSKKWIGCRDTKYML